MFSLIPLKEFEKFRIRRKDEGTIFIHCLFVDIEGLDKGIEIRILSKGLGILILVIIYKER